MQVSDTHSWARRILSGLAHEAAQAGQADAPGPAAQRAAQQCQAAGAALKAALRGVPSPQQAAQQYSAQLEPAAVQAAEALEAWWEASGAAQQRQLELAQAAATRCCAYLR